MGKFILAMDAGMDKHQQGAHGPTVEVEQRYGADPHPQSARKCESVRCRREKHRVVGPGVQASRLLRQRGLGGGIRMLAGGAAPSTRQSRETESSERLAENQCLP